MRFTCGFVRVVEIDPVSGKTICMVANVALASVESADGEAFARLPSKLAEMREKIARQAEAEVRSRKS